MRPHLGRRPGHLQTGERSATQRATSRGPATFAPFAACDGIASIGVPNSRSGENAIRLTLLVFVLLLVAGIAPRANAQDPSAACIEQIKNDPRLKSLWGKYPFDPSKGLSLEVMSNRHKPNADDRAALSYLATEGERCFDLGADWRMANYPVQISALLTTYRVDALSAMADLYAGRITFGEMAKTRARLTSDLTTQAEAVVSKLKADRAAEEQRQRDRAAQLADAEAAARQHQQEVAEQRSYAEAQVQAQQEAAAKLQAEAARRQAVLRLLKFNPISLPQPPKTVTTNCWAAGNAVNCTSR